MTLSEVYSEVLGAVADADGRLFESSSEENGYFFATLAKGRVARPGNVDRCAESINDYLTRFQEDIDGKQYWPVVLPYLSRAVGDAYTYTVLEPGGMSVPNHVCCLQPGAKGKYRLGPINKTLFLAADSSRYPGGDKALPQLITEYHQYGARGTVKIGVPAAKAAATGSLGAGRCDKVEEVEYVWLGNQALGKALGLSEMPFREPGGCYYQLPESPTSADIATIKDQLEGKGFHLTNFPECSEILYFKRFRKRVDPEKRNKPRANSPEPSYVATGWKGVEFGVRKKMKTGKALGPTAKERATASEVMRRALAELVVGAPFNTSGSATDFVKAMAFRPGDDFDQEWCHLLGHGDGGEETPSNFISGSQHCNSEQLAIEEAQRIWSYRKDVNDLQARITAYARPDDLQVPAKVRLPEDSPAGIIKRKSKKENYDYLAFDGDHEAIKAFLVPLGDPDPIKTAYLRSYYPEYMRYKIRLGLTGKNTIFDHVYRAQSQSFNYHEYKILKTTVDRRIAEALEKADVENYEGRIQAKLIDRDYRIGPVAFKRTDTGVAVCTPAGYKDPKRKRSDTDTDTDTDRSGNRQRREVARHER